MNDFLAGPQVDEQEFDADFMEWLSSIEADPHEVDAEFDEWFQANISAEVPVT